MIKTTMTAIVALMMMFTASNAFAGSGVVDKFSDSELIQIMRSEGYTVKKVKAGTLVIKINGRSYAIFNRKDGDLQAYYGMSGAKVSYEDINGWNKSKRLSRAYLDSKHDPVLEADLLANGGISEKKVLAFFKVFKISVRAYRKFIASHDKS